MEANLDRRSVISALLKSHHGNLTEYEPLGRPAVLGDEEFYAHLCTWNHVSGQVRDARVALPVLALNGRDRAYVESALALLADLNPRELARALDFARQAGVHSNMLRRLVVRYLRDLEAGPFGKFEGIALQHRAKLRRLYTLYHVKPSPVAQRAIVAGHGGTHKADVLKSLATLSPLSAAQAVIEAKIPFLVARGALGKVAKDPDVLLALIDAMSSVELITNMKWLESAGVQTVPALRAALARKLTAAEKEKPKSQLLKANRASASVGALRAQLSKLQEAHLDATKGLEGSWLVLADKSGSMSHAIGLSREVAALLARVVKGDVYLVFFDSDAREYSVKGMTLSEIEEATVRVTAGGSTCIGCGVELLRAKGRRVDGIVVVSDGAENVGVTFVQAYRKYADWLGADPSVYFYHTSGEANVLNRRLSAAGVDFSEFDLTGPVDYSSLPNLVATMRPGKYGLVDEILATPLRRIDDVLKHTKGQEVIGHGITARKAQDAGDREAVAGRGRRDGGAGEGPARRVRRAEPAGTGGDRRRTAKPGA